MKKSATPSNRGGIILFKSTGGIIGFLAGLGLTVGLLLAPHLVPWDFGYGAGLAWPLPVVILAGACGLAVLALTLWAAGRLVRGAENWRQGRVIAGAVLIAAVANTLFMFLVDLFALRSGPRALVAVLGVPVIYGNLAAVLGQRTLREAMAEILAGVLTTMGAGFIVVAMIRGF